MDHRRLLPGSVIILLLAATVTVAACGGGASTALTPSATPASTPTAIPTATPAPTPTNTPTATPTATPVPSIPIANQEARTSIDGDWEGATIYRLRELVTRVHFERTEEGIQGTLDFPQIGRRGLPLSNVSFEPPKVHFELSEFSTVFDGELNGDTISGEFVDPDGSGPFSLQRMSP